MRTIFEEIIPKVSMYAQVIGAIFLAIASIILVIKMMKKKLDKNNDGKITSNEIEKADIEFCKELLKESFRTIAIGINKYSGMNNTQAFNLTLNELKKSKNIFENSIKGEENQH